jgi:hypothetical protein
MTVSRQGLFQTEATMKCILLEAPPVYHLDVRAHVDPLFDASSEVKGTISLGSADASGGTRLPGGELLTTPCGLDHSIRYVGTISADG